METPIIVAIIAATVSVISVIVTLYISYKSRQHSVIALSEKDAIENKRLSEREFKEYLVQTELYRVRLWNFESFLSRMPGGRLGTTYTAEMIENFKHFKNYSIEYLEEWSKVKANIPDVLTDRLRRDRHHIRHLIDDISFDVAKMNPTDEYPEISGENFKIGYRVKDELETLIELLDKQFSYLNQFRFQLFDLGFTLDQYRDSSLVGIDFNSKKNDSSNE